MKKKREFLKGDIYYCDLGKNENSEQGGIRPVLIVQNDYGNKYSPTTIVCAITSQEKKKNLPTHIKLNVEDIDRLKKNSIVLIEQIMTIDKDKLKDYVGSIDDLTIMKVENALQISFGMFN